MKRLLSILLILLLAGLALFAIQRWLSHAPEQTLDASLPLYPDHEFYQSTDGEQVINEPIHPLPHLKKLSGPLAQKVALGRTLFHDPRLSGNGKISCASCHNLNVSGHDPRGVSSGITHEPLRRNSPTVYNAAFNAHQF